MIYTAINELNHFEYHDAELNNISWLAENLLWELSAINATTENTQNSSCKDMCVGNAEITFEYAHIESIVFTAYQVYDSNNILINSVEARTTIPEEYDEILKESLRSFCYIMSMDEYKGSEEERYIARFNIYAGIGGYDLTISFSKSTVAWNEFSGEAWYEHPKWKNQ